MNVDRESAENELERFADVHDGFWAMEPRFLRRKVSPPLTPEDLKGSDP